MSPTVHLRSNDPVYLGFVGQLFAQLANETAGLYWKDDGPIVAVQLENEYGGPAEHLLTLRAMAINVSIDVPFYTKTAWPATSTPMPWGNFVPFYGAYADAFWSRSLEPDPSVDVYVFQSKPDTTNPWVSCELGGGMETSYHRRVFMFPADMASEALVQFGSGNTWLGYYMYSGGTNPTGQLSTMEECQAAGGYNDMPVKSYDFFAPLGEFGAVHPHYHAMRLLHIFLQAYGARTAAMPGFLPAYVPAPTDNTTVRWAVRGDGVGGLLVVNNYQRLTPMAAKPASRFRVLLQVRHWGYE